MSETRYAGMGSWELVAAVQRGDREAFGEIYSRYRGVVWRYVQSRVGDRGLVEDLTSETFVRALARIDSVRERGCDVGAWLVTIARNLLLDHLKRSATRREVHRAQLPETASGEAGPQQRALAALDRDAVRVALTRLCPAQRECVRLCFELDLPVGQAAAAMRRSVRAVSSLRWRAVRTLAGLLDPGNRGSGPVPDETNGDICARQPAAHWRAETHQARTRATHLTERAA